MTKPSWSVGELFMVRIAGLPIEATHPLRAPAACRWADDVYERETDLAVRGAALADLLAQRVTGAADGDRRTLVNLRRTVFNGRLPADEQAAIRLADDLGGDTGTALAGWLRDRHRLADARAKGPDLLADELRTARAALRELLATDRLRYGILLASPSLDRYLDSYLAADPDRLTKRHRRQERSALEYLYRTAGKTSPFSTFTGLALGEVAEPGEAPATIDERWTHHPRLNIAVLNRISELVVDSPGLRADLPVTLVPGWRDDLDRIRYVRREVTVGDSAAPISFDAVRESLYFLRHGDSLDRMIAAFRDHPARRFGDLVAELAATGEAGPEDYDRYLSVLLRLGLLQVSALSVPVHCTDPLRDFQLAVRGLGTSWSGALADRLERPVALLAGYPDADLAGRRQILAGLAAELVSVQEQLGAEAPTMPKTLVYEDARAAATVLPGPSRGWLDAVGDSLRSVATMTPAFDASQPQRLMLTAFFRARYGVGGRCDDVLKLVYDFQEEIYDQYMRVSMQQQRFGADGSYRGHENWLGSPEITALDTARQEFRDRMSALPDGDEVELDRDATDAVADALTPLRWRLRPQCHFVQPVWREGTPLAVLNRSLGGVSFLFSRFTHCFADLDLAPRLRAAARELQPAGTVFAEVTGGFPTTNLNLHGQLCDYEVVCPGEVSTAPAEAQIRLDDLILEHDPDADRLVLRSRRLGAEVVPLYFGYLVPMALPEVARTLLLLSPASQATLDVWAGVPERAARDGVCTRPRVRHGALVLARRSWTVPSAALPRATPTGTDADWFLAWRRWRARHEVPAQVFATVQTSDESGQQQWFGRAKPHYLDFDSYLSLRVLDSLIRDEAASVVLHEMLPGESDIYARSSAGRHVAELVIETALTQQEPSQRERT